MVAQLFDSLPRAVLREEYDHIASLSNMLCEAARNPDSVERMASHHLFAGLEFAVMRAAWLLGEEDEAERIHSLIGDHSDHACPVCRGDDAFATESQTETAVSGENGGGGNRTRVTSHPDVPPEQADRVSAAAGEPRPSLCNTHSDATERVDQ